MKLKLLLAGILLSVSTVAFAWPPIPKAISIGHGTYIDNGVKIPFLWGIMRSLARERNIYVLISTSITESDRYKIESKLEVILHDEGSTVIRVKLDTSNKSVPEIVKYTTDRITNACPEISFEINPDSYERSRQ